VVGLHPADKSTHLSQKAISRGMESLDQMVVHDQNRLKKGEGYENLRAGNQVR